MTARLQRQITRPRPDLVRRPTAGFGWLDQAILHGGWLAQLGPDGSALLLLLALAADRHGASFYSRHRMADALSISISQVDAALHRLRDLELVDYRPWHEGSRDGVWQLLPLPLLHHQPRAQRVLGIGEILASLGFTATPNYAANWQRQNAPPDAGAE
jgi:hypothetical protein